MLPSISLDLWQNFGGAAAYETGRAIIRRAFDRGVTHFDLAINDCPPPGLAEDMFCRVLATVVAARCDELIVATKTDMTCGPAPPAISVRANSSRPASTRARRAWVWRDNFREKIRQSG